MKPGKVALARPLKSDLRKEVMAALHQKGYPHHRMLKIDTDRSIVLVQGILPTYHLRQVAVECIKRVAGVTGVVDQIQVVREMQDDAALWFQTAELQPVIERTDLEADVCPTAGVPLSGVLPVHNQAGKDQSNPRILEEGDSTDPWFPGKVDIPSEERLEAVCS